MPIIMGVHSNIHTNVPKDELGFILLGAVAFSLWVMLCFWLSEKYFDYSIMVAVGSGVLLPMTIIGLILI